MPPISRLLARRLAGQTAGIDPKRALKIAPMTDGKREGAVFGGRTTCVADRDCRAGRARLDMDHAKLAGGLSFRARSDADAETNGV